MVRVMGCLISMRLPKRGMRLSKQGKGWIMLDESLGDGLTYTHERVSKRKQGMLMIGGILALAV